MNLQTGKVRISKKALCVILSIIMAFGTFITFTVGYSPLHEWLGIRNMLSAYAAEFVDTNGAVAVDEDAMLADDHTINLENKDGSNTVYLFSEPISYTDDKGNLKTKDISVEKAGSELKKEGYDFTNGQNDYRINFSKNYNKGIQTEFEGASYSIIPQSIIKVDGEEAVAEYLEENFEVFQYKNIYGNGTNLRFYPQLNGVKDEIILNQNINKNTFSFELKTENCTAQLNEDGTISLVNKEGTTIQTFAAPFAYDSEYVEGDNNNHYVDCEYTLEDKNETSYIMTITVPNEWLNSANTKYPVTIDPTTSNISQAKDAGTYKKYKTQNWGSEQLCCFGYSSDYDKGRVYTQFTLPAAIKKGATINSAYQWERETTGRTTSTKVIGYMVKASWSETGITWENKPGYNSSYATNKRTINSSSTDNSSPYWYKFSIKSIVNQWINGGSANYGITFRSDEEDNLNKNWRAFASRSHSTSSYRPYAVINYTNETTKPTVEITKSPDGWTNQNVTFTIKASDSGSGLPSAAYAFSNSAGSYTYGTAKTKTYSKNQTVYFAVKDNAGNVATASRGTYIDKLNPNVPTKVSGNDGVWTNQNVVVKVAVSDRAKTDNDGCSGIASYSCTKSATPSSNSSDWKSVSDGATQITLPTISSYGTYYVFVKDKAGNISSYPYTKRDYENNSAHTVTHKGYQFTAYIDKTEPVIDDVNLHYDEELGHNVLTVEAHDENEGCNYCSGIKAYSKNGGQDWEPSNTTSYNFDNVTIDDDIQIAVMDKAGNITHYDENPQVKVPIIYQEDKYVKIINPNENLKLQYKINDGSYVNYNEPIELENGVQTTITAIILGTNKSVTKTFTYQAPATVTPFTEEQTDITITDNSASFDVSRYYNSNTNDWFFSTQSAITEIEENYVYSVQMPDSQILYFVNENNQFVNEDTDYTLTIEDASYVIDCGDYSLHYNKDNGRLSCVDDKDSHGINFSYTNDKLTSIYAEEGNERHEYSVTEDNDGKIQSITTPLGEKLKYDYSSGKIVKVFYDKDTLQFTRDDDIIISEYEYLNNRILKTNGNTVNYDGNGHCVSITTTWNETIENEPEQTEPEVTEPEQTQPSNEPQPVYTYFEGTEIVQTETITEGNSTTIITYDIEGKTVSESYSTDGKTTVTSYTYDNWGNVLTQTNTKVENGVSVPISGTAYVYDDLNRCIKETLSVPNENDKITLYAYNPLGNIIYERTGSEVTRTLYDKYGRVIQGIEPQDYSASDDGIQLDNDVLSGNDSYSNTNIGHRYVYDTNTRLLTQEINRLDVVTNYTYHPNTSVVATETFDVYVLSYNTEGKITNSTVNGELYATYSYDETTGNPTAVVYENGQSIHYVYDQNTGNLLNQYHNDDENNPYVVYDYVPAPENTQVDTGEQLELEENLEVTTNEDYVIKHKTNYDSNLYYTYYNSGKVEVAKANDTNTVIYSYKTTNADDNSSTTVSGVAGNKEYSVVTTENGITNTYDGNSLSAENTINDTVTTTNVKVNNTTAFTVTETENTTSDVKSYGSGLTYTDNYNNPDKLQISSSSDGTNTTNYTYYDDGQLHTVSGNNYSASYTYDGRGNLTEKTVNNVTTNYGYTNDRLTTVGNMSLTYDSIGNVLTYGSKSYTWNSGRNLASITDGTDNFTYAYNKYGYRTSKTVNGVTTDFNVAEDGTIISQSDGTNRLFFEYAEDGTPLGFVLNDTQYLYITNNSADIMAIADSTGNVIATYSYNEWGEVTVIASEDNLELANLNPLRYRGYYYDTETGYYYLQSRYYDPSTCRFINADLPECVKIQLEQKAGINIYIYCCNNPINLEDRTGNLAFLAKVLIAAAIGGLVGASAEALIQFVFEKKKNPDKWDWKAIGIEFVSGAINGALIACHLSPKTKTVLKGITTAITSIAHNFNKGNFKTPKKAVISVLTAIVSTIATMYITFVSEHLKRIMGKNVSTQSIMTIAKKITFNRLRRAAIRFTIRVGKWSYDFIID